MYLRKYLICATVLNTQALLINRVTVKGNDVFALNIGYFLIFEKKSYDLECDRINIQVTKFSFRNE